MPRAMTEQAKKEKSKFILKKAFELYEKRTFKTFKMDELAQVCEMSKGILFKYFRTKEMLFLSMLDQEYEKMLEAYEYAFLLHDTITPDVVRD